jgi:hypothetical protein
MNWRGCGIGRRGVAHASCLAGIPKFWRVSDHPVRDFGTGPFFEVAATPPFQGGEWPDLAKFLSL